MFVKGQKYRVGSVHAERHYYDDIIGKIVTYVKLSTNSAPSHKVEESKKGKQNFFWYVHEEDLLPVEESNGLYAATLDQHL